MDPEVAPYKLEPPSWRPPLLGGIKTSSADQNEIGAPDYFPPLDSLPEFNITEEPVRNGFPARPAVGNETFSAHDMIYDRLRSRTMTKSLNTLMGEIFKRREELQRDKIAPSAHKLPSRVTLNDSKLATYVKELADATVPLTKLAKNVPHGFKGEKMLDMLYNGASNSSANQTATGTVAASSSGRPGTPSTPSSASMTFTPPASVPLNRALWFIQVVGATDMQASKNKAAFILLDWTNALCSWLRKQLSEVMLHPSAIDAIADATLQQFASEESLMGKSPAPLPQVPTTPTSVSTPSAGISNLQVNTANLSNAGRHRTMASSARTPVPSPLLGSPSKSRAPPTPSQSRVANQGAGSSMSFIPTAAQAAASAPMSDVACQRWASKWSYSLALLRGMQDAYLLHMPTYLKFASDSLANANIAQLQFPLALVEENLSLYSKGTNLAKGLIDACLTAAQTVQAAQHAIRGSAKPTDSEKIDTSDDGHNGFESPSKFLASLSDSVQSILVRTAKAHPQAIVSLRMWTNFPKEMEALLQQMEGLVDVTEVKERVARLQLEHISAKIPSVAWFDQEAADLDILDCIDLSSNLHTAFVEYFSSEGQEEHHPTGRGMRDKIELLLLWATTSHRSGFYRAYIAADFLSSLKKCNFNLSKLIPKSERKGRTKASNPAHHMLDLHSICSYFITQVARYSSQDEPADAAKDAHITGMELLRRRSFASVDFDALINLLEECSRRGVFSPSKLIRRVATLSNRTDSSEEEVKSKNLLLRILRALPLENPAQNLLHTRRQCIYGLRTTESWEEAAERRTSREVRALLPRLFGANELEDIPDADATTQATKSLVDKQLARLRSAPAFVQRRITRQVLWPAIQSAKEAIYPQEALASLLVFEMGGDYIQLGQVLQMFLKWRLARDCKNLVLELVQQNALLWHIMGLLPTMLAQLCDLAVEDRSSGDDSFENIVGKLLLHLQRKGSRDAALAMDYLSEESGRAREEQQRGEILATLRTSFHRPEELELNMKGCLQQYGETLSVVAAGMQAALQVVEQWGTKKVIDLSAYVDMIVDVLRGTASDLDSVLLEWSGDTPIFKLVSTNASLLELLCGAIDAQALSPKCVLNSMVVPALTVMRAEQPQDAQGLMSLLSELLYHCTKSGQTSTLDANTAFESLKSLSQLSSDRTSRLATAESPDLLAMLYDLCQGAQRQTLFRKVLTECADIWTLSARSNPEPASGSAADQIQIISVWSLERDLRTLLQPEYNDSEGTSNVENVAEHFVGVFLQDRCSAIGCEVLPLIRNPSICAKIWTQLLGSFDVALRNLASLPAEVNPWRGCLSACVAFRTFCRMPVYQTSDLNVWASIMQAVANVLHHHLESSDTPSQGIDDILDVILFAITTANIWTNAIKPTFSNILKSLIEMARLRCADQEDASRLLDVTASILESGPPELIATALQLGSQIRQWLAHDPTLQMQEFLMLLSPPSIQATPASTQIVATSLRGAVQYGQYQPAPEKPWEWTPTLERPDTIDLLRESIDPSTRLQNTGSLSLSSFGAVKLRDTVPVLFDEREPVQRKAHDDSQITRFLESELSYGESLAEPASVRAARRAQVWFVEKQSASILAQMARTVDGKMQAQPPKPKPIAMSEPIEISDDDDDQSAVKAKSAASTATQGPKKRKSTANLNSGSQAKKRKGNTMSS